MLSFGCSSSIIFILILITFNLKLVVLLVPAATVVGLLAVAVAYLCCFAAACHRFLSLSLVLIDVREGWEVGLHDRERGTAYFL